jgi:hypothetical protein
MALNDEYDIDNNQIKQHLIIGGFDSQCYFNFYKWQERRPVNIQKYISGR